MYRGHMDGAEVLESDVEFYLKFPIRTTSGVANAKQGRQTAKSCHTSCTVAQFRPTFFLSCLRTSKKNPSSRVERGDETGLN